MNQRPRLSPELALCLALFGSARMMAAFWQRPHYTIFDDLLYPFAALSDSGFCPFVHYWQEYPPLIPYVSVGIYQSLAWLWPMPPVLHHQAYLIAFQWLSALFDVGNALLIYRIAGRVSGKEKGQFAALAYCLSFAVLFVGASFFDGVALFFALLAIYWFLDDRPAAAGIALALGIMTKIVPLAILPAFIKFRKDTPQAVRLVGALVLAVGLLWGPFFVVDPAQAIMPFRANSARPAWETVWAFLEGQFHFGYLGPDLEKLDRLPPVPEAVDEAVARVQFFSQADDPNILRLRVRSRFSTDLASFPQSPGPWIYTASGLAFLALFVVTWRRIPGGDPVGSLPYAGFLLLLLLLYSKGWSPQFVIFPAAFLILVYPTPGGALALLALTLLNFLEMPIWLYFFRTSSAGPGILGILVILRTLFLAVMAWLMFRKALQPSMVCSHAKSG